MMGQHGVSFISRNLEVIVWPADNLSRLTPDLLEPVRMIGGAAGSVEHAPRPTNYQGQRHIGGTYWFERSQRRLPYASGLERLRLQFADIDRNSIDAVSQPYLIVFVNKKKTFRHIPDVLISRRNQSLLLVDVRPTKFQQKSEEAFCATAELCQDIGIDYEVWDAPDNVYVQNIRFLSGFRRTFLGFNSVAPDILAHTSRQLCTVQNIMDSLEFPEHQLRPALFHLIWRGDLEIELNLPFRQSSLVRHSVEASAGGIQ